MVNVRVNPLVNFGHELFYDCVPGFNIDSACLCLNPCMPFGKSVVKKWLQPVHAVCAIGDEKINGIPYGQIVETAREYIRSIGGFEKFAEWGLLRYEDNN